MHPKFAGYCTRRVSTFRPELFREVLPQGRITLSHSEVLCRIILNARFCSNSLLFRSSLPNIMSVWPEILHIEKNVSKSPKNPNVIWSHILCHFHFSNPFFSLMRKQLKLLVKHYPSCKASLVCTGTQPHPRWIYRQTTSRVHCSQNSKGLD